jgi:voltage-gated potassium channel
MSTAQQDEQVLVEIRRRLFTAGGAVLVLFAVGVTGYMLIDTGQHRLLDSLYMTVITLTTVGYAEIIPLDAHPWGRVFTMVLLLFGMGILVYFASAVTAFLVEGQLGQVFWRKRMRQAIAALREHYIVCGAGTVAGHVLEELIRVQRPVVAIVPPGATPPSLGAGTALLYLEGDPADEDVLREAGVDRARGLVPALDSDRDNVLVTLTARQIKSDLRIVAMLVDHRHEAKLRRAGADAVVSPYRIGGLRMASELIRPVAVTFLDQMLRDRDKNLRVDEVRICGDSPAVGKRIGDLKIDEQPGLLLLALVAPDGQRYEYKPDAGARIEAGSTLVVMGSPEAAAHLRERFGGGPCPPTEGVNAPAGASAPASS